MASRPSTAAPWICAYAGQSRRRSSARSGSSGNRQEAECARRAIEAKLGQTRPRRGRPPKLADKYAPVSIRLHPRVLAWAKREAKRRGLVYQTVINGVLLKATA